MALNFLDYMPVISSLIFAGLLTVSLLQFSAVRRNMHMQSEQQMYARIMDARIRLENSEAFTRMAKESPLFLERFSVVNNPEEYYTAVAFLDLIELLYHVNKTKSMDEQQWMRWKELAKALMTIPKFKKVWDKTKQVHAADFVAFIDSL